LDVDDVELWRRAKLVRGLAAVREAVQRATRSVLEAQDPNVMLVDRKATAMAIRTELRRLLGSALPGGSGNRV
jgi:hypothetical protein